MALQDIERLVTELLNTGEMNEDTQADLARILDEARAGASHPDDLDYLRALHRRILSPDHVAEDQPESGDDVEGLRQQIAQLRAELADARQTIAELEARLATGV